MSDSQINYSGLNTWIFSSSAAVTVIVYRYNNHTTFPAVFFYRLGVIGAVDKVSIMADFDSTSRDYHLAYSPQNSYDCLVKDDSNDTGYQSPRHVPYKQNISDLSLQSVQSNSCTCSIM